MVTIPRKKQHSPYYNMHDVSRGSGPTDEFFYIVWNFHARGTKRLISIEFFQALESNITSHLLWCGVRRLLMYQVKSTKIFNRCDENHTTKLSRIWACFQKKISWI